MVISHAHVERLAERVRVARIERGLTMRGLAQAAGVDVAYVSRIESASYRLPNPMYLQAIADALHVSPVALFLAVGYLRPDDLRDRG